LTAGAFTANALPYFPSDKDTVNAPDTLPDLRYAIRTLSKSPLFVAVAILSLALGIGANTAIFSLIDQLLLRMLPVKNPTELVLLTGEGQHYGGNNGRHRLSYPMYADIRDRNGVFSGMFCSSGVFMSANFGGRPEHATGEFVSGNYFRVLGVGAAIGRVFTERDDLQQGAHPVAVLSYEYWQSRFGLDPSVVGRKVLINGYPFSVVGVSQAGFDGTDVGRTPEIRVPMMMRRQLVSSDFAGLSNRRMRWVSAYGRLKPGMSMDRAKAGLQSLFHQIINMEVQQAPFAHASANSKDGFLKMSMGLTPAAKGQSQLRRQFSKPLWVLMCVVGLVLLIACANVANLLIARATARQKEIAVRLALGAGRRRILAQLLTESLLLSLTGGLAGLLLAVWIDRTLVGFLPSEGTPLTISTVPDWRILVFNLGVSILTGIIFGLAPALQATKPELASTLKDQASAVVGGASVRFRKALVVAQVALSLLLLVGAGLFIRSLQNLRDLDPGFRTGNMLAFSVDAPLNGYPEARSLQIYRDLTERLNSLPGVQSASLAVMPVLQGDEWDNWVTVEGYTPKPNDIPDPHMNFVSSGHFRTLGVPMLAGRDFDTRDERGSSKVCIVNEKFAKHYLGSNAVGHHIGMGGDPGTKTDITIVGVVRDTKYESMRDEMPEEVFQPYRQVDFVLGMNAYVRTTGDPNATFGMVRDAVRGIDSNLPVTDMRTLEKQMDLSLMTERLVASLSTAFALLATLLAGIGLYGVMAYTVTWRTREIGIRMALGAFTGDVIWLVMREVLLLLAIGMAIGLPAAWGLSRLVAAQLYGLTPNDPVSILAAAIGIASVALAAGYLPARRATRVDPMRALRWE
jgi:predicted permease